MKLAFLEHLAASQNVAQAARAVGMSRQSAYRLRAREDEAFNEAWDRALESQLEILHQALLERAIHGTRVAHYYRGQHTHDSVRFHERLAIHLHKSMTSERRRATLLARSPLGRRRWSSMMKAVERYCGQTDDLAPPLYLEQDEDTRDDAPDAHL